jgi:hypothetical protein
MTLMRNLRMTTCLYALAIVITDWRFRTASDWGFCAGSTAVAIEILKGSLPTAAAGAFVTKLGAGVIATFEGSVTNASADVLRFELLVPRSSIIERLQFPFQSLPFNSLTFSRAASFSTLVASAIYRGFTDS